MSLGMIECNATTLQLAEISPFPVKWISLIMGISLFSSERKENPSAAHWKFALFIQVLKPLLTGAMASEAERDGPSRRFACSAILADPFHSQFWHEIQN
jgi:hypothetical protein